MTGTDLPEGLTVLPTPLPDETLYSLVARTHKLNDIDSAIELCEVLLGDMGRMRVSDAVVDMEHFHKATNGFYDDSSWILSSMATSPLYRRLGTHPHVETPREFSSEHDIALGEPSGLAELSNGRAHIWRWCPMCYARDREAHGIAYWHRVHLLPGAVICREHGVSLLEVCLPYRSRQGCFVLPADLAQGLDVRMVCGRGPPPSMTMALVEFSTRALMDTTFDSTPSTIQGAIVDGLSALGLVSRHGRINKQAFLTAFADRYVDLAVIEEFAPLLAANSLRRIVDHLNHSTTLLPATMIVMLGVWLFETWELFRNHCTWRGIMPSPASLQTHPKETISSNTKTTANRHRQTCVDFLTSNPGATRSDYWATHPKNCRWLVKNDHDWLDKVLPLRSGYRQLQLCF